MTLVPLRRKILVLLVPLVAGCASAAPRESGQTRVYYIAADEVDWDYAPSGRDRITGALFDTSEVFIRPDFPGSAPLYFNVKRENYDSGVAGGLTGIGRIYRKALYREYTDSTFSEPKPRPPEWEHLGFLGPLLRAEVGDTIVVVFRNNGKRPFSLHPHGVFYDKASEGTPYVDGTEGAAKADDAVSPGSTHTYTWPVPERAGPGPNDPSSVLWMYHSHVHEDEDIATGLIGPMIVTARGRADAEGAPEDVDRELVTMFSHGVENDSWYFGDNIRTYIPGMDVDEAIAQPFFGQTNGMYSINGFLYGNLPLPEIRIGERVRWYLFAGTNAGDLHTVHWHGQTVLVNGRRTDMIELEPMMMVVADMEPDNPGTWFYHCHVDFHFKGGMSALFRVLPGEGIPEVEDR